MTPEIGLLVATCGRSSWFLLDSDLAVASLAQIDINCRAPVVLVHELGARCRARTAGSSPMSSLVYRDRYRERRCTRRPRSTQALAEGPRVRAADRGVVTWSRSVRVDRTGGSPLAADEWRARTRHGTRRRRTDALAALGSTRVDRRRCRQPRRRSDVRGMARRDVVELDSRFTRHSFHRIALMPGRGCAGPKFC